MSIPTWARAYFPSSKAWSEFRDRLVAALASIDPTAELAADRPEVYLRVGTVVIEDLAQYCHESGDTAGTIAAWAAAASESLQDVSAQATMTWDEVAPSLRVQLYNDQRHEAAPMVARRLADDLWLALVLDTDQAMTILTPDLVAPWQQSEDALFERAAANVMNGVEVAPSPAAVPPPLRICSSDNDYTAVAVYLALDELIGEPSHGALVMFPTRFTASYLPVDGAVPAAPYQVMLNGTRRAFDTGEGALTPKLYWWHERRLTCVPMITVGASLVAMWPDALKPLLAKP